MQINGAKSLAIAGPPAQTPRLSHLFSSFFPAPKLFFGSVVIWTALCTFGWYTLGDDIGNWIGLPPPGPDDPPVIGLGHFTTNDFLTFYVYCFITFLIFAFTWMRLAPHKWQWWSIWGSAAIIFSAYYSVQVSVAINNWRRPFFDMVQAALSGESEHTPSEFYFLLLQFTNIALMWMLVFVVTRFFTSHYVFRWRTAMNDYYMSRWSEVRTIEGAAQRVQEDTMRFAAIVEGLGVSMIDAIMTLFAFLPVLAALSVHVATLPIVGEIAAPLLWAAVLWSAFGTLLLAIAGIRLPGLEFMNQRVEAAYRKELVYGEDDENRADPMTATELFGHVRRNYFRLYFHYAYFNIFRGLYIQADNIFAMFILVPTIAAGAITFGILQQILTAFGQVSNSFQYLVNSWTTIVDLLSIYKRLRAFEAQFRGQSQAAIEGAALPGE